jgi:hypothetical protein
LVDLDFPTTVAIDKQVRSIQGSTPKVISCGVQGVCGYVMDDFGDKFQVEDADGELQKEVRDPETLSCNISE